MAKDPKDTRETDDFGEAVLGKTALSVLVGNAQRNLLGGAVILATGVVLVALGGSSKLGSSSTAVVGWGCLLAGAMVLAYGLAQRFWPIDVGTPELRQKAQERRDVAGMALFAGLIFLPYLGAVGLWDPWEVHYGEVARTMVVKRDFIYPYWESAYFFSKPPLTMWLQGLGLAVTGSTSENGALGLYTEWGMRLPFALLSVLAVSLITLSISRVFGRRAGLIAGFATATSPLYFLLARQAVTDTPFVTLLVCGMSCFIIAEFDPKTRGELGEDGRPKPGTGNATIWWCWTYAFFGLATLAKGLLGFALPGLVLLVYILVTASGDETGEDARNKVPSVANPRMALAKFTFRALLANTPLRRARILHGLVIFLAISVPWILTLSLFQGVDDESKGFAYRFFIHDHFNRLTAGVHTTTPGGTFTYFIEQLGFAMFPWVALVPGAMVAVGKLAPRNPDPKNRAALFVTIWTAASFFVFSMSATKFHHYCFPVVPPLAILCALWAERLWKDGVEENAVPILLGLGFFAVVGQNLWLEPKVLPNMYIYQYERTYPMREAGDQAKQVFAVLFIGGGLWLALAYIWRAKAMLVGTFAAVALLFAGYVSWIHWEKLTPHWTQRELMWSYFQERGSPNEPIIAYYMNWRGETFYSSNLVRQIKDNTHWDEVLAQPGRFWVVVEQSRFAGMKTSVESKGKHVKLEDKTSNKFYLASVQ